MAGADGDQAAARGPSLWIERDGGESGDGEPEPGAAEGERERDEQVRYPRQQRERDETARQQRRAAERGGTAVEPSLERANGKRRRRAAR